MTILTVSLLVTFAFVAGIAVTVAAGILIERRVLARPGARLEVAARLVEDYADQIGAPL